MPEERKEMKMQLPLPAEIDGVFYILSLPNP
jgi:hypothetical protein